MINEMYAFAPFTWWSLEALEHAIGYDSLCTIKVRTVSSQFTFLITLWIPWAAENMGGEKIGVNLLMFWNRAREGGCHFQLTRALNQGVYSSYNSRMCSHPARRILGVRQPCQRIVCYEHSSANTPEKQLVNKQLKRSFFMPLSIHQKNRNRESFAGSTKCVQHKTLVNSKRIVYRRMYHNW